MIRLLTYLSLLPMTACLTISLKEDKASWPSAAFAVDPFAWEQVSSTATTLKLYNPQKDIELTVISTCDRGAADLDIKQLHQNIVTISNDQIEKTLPASVQDVSFASLNDFAQSYWSIDNNDHPRDIYLTTTKTENCVHDFVATATHFDADQMIALTRAATSITEFTDADGERRITWQR